MREQESHYTVRADYMSSSDATNAVISPQDRRDICSWSYKVTDAMSIDRSAAVIGMSYLDRFMCTSSPGAKAALLSRTEYQLTAVACLVIALKCRSGIKAGTDFVSRGFCQGEYDADELERMEVEILGALTWRLNGPSPHDFVDAIVGLIPTYCSDGATSMLVFAAKVYVEAAVLNHRMAMQPSSSLRHTALLASMETASVFSAFCPENLDAWVADVVVTGGGMGATDRVFAQGLADVARRRWSMSTTLSSSPSPSAFPIIVGGVVGTPRSHVGRARKSTITASFKGYAAVNEDAIHPCSTTSSIMTPLSRGTMNEYYVDDAYTSDGEFQQIDGLSPISHLPLTQADFRKLSFIFG
jgi:hypothetical protein